MSITWSAVQHWPWAIIIAAFNATMVQGAIVWVWGWGWALIKQFFASAITGAITGSEFSQKLAGEVASKVIADVNFQQSLADLVVNRINGTYVSQKKQDAVNSEFRDRLELLDQGQQQMSKEFRDQAAVQQKQHESNSSRLEKLDQLENIVEAIIVKRNAIPKRRK